MVKKPEILAVTPIAKSDIFQIEKVHLKFANKNERHFERLKPHNSGAVMIVPVLDADNFLLVREYAVGIEQYVLGLPKGLVEPDEDIKLAANRELQEEVGFKANKLTMLTTFDLAPQYMSHQMQLLLAQDLIPSKLEGDEPEPLEIIPWAWSDLDELLAKPCFSEARSIAALFLARKWLKNK